MNVHSVDTYAFVLSGETGCYDYFNPPKMLSFSQDAKFSVAHDQRACLQRCPYPQCGKEK